MKRIAFATALAAVAAAAGCGPKRTAAASQPTPAAFNPASSDAKAVATVDAGMAALGGYASWTKLQELKFELKYMNKNEVKGWFRHAWDRWNGRHDFEMADPATLSGPPDKIGWLDVKYDLFNSDGLPFATYNGKELSHEEARKYREIGRQHLHEDAYLLLIIYKARDPGVHLSDAGEAKNIIGASDICEPSCQVVKLTFDPSVGKDTWYVSYNSQTHLPQMIEKEASGGRIGYKLLDWVDAGGLKWPTKLVNVGLPDEVFRFENIVVDEPKESTYVPSVDRAQYHDRNRGP
jgi:hypothetical protein